MTTDLQALGDDLFAALSRRAGPGAAVATGSVPPRSSSAPSASSPRRRSPAGSRTTSTSIRPSGRSSAGARSTTGRPSTCTDSASPTARTRLSSSSTTRGLHRTRRSCSMRRRWLLAGTSPVPCRPSRCALLEGRAAAGRVGCPCGAGSDFPVRTDADATRRPSTPPCGMLRARAVPRPRVRGRTGAVRVRGRSAGCDADAGRSLTVR